MGMPADFRSVVTKLSRAIGERGHRNSEQMDTEAVLNGTDQTSWRDLGLRSHGEGG